LLEENGAEKAQACKMKFTIVIGVFFVSLFFPFPQFLTPCKIFSNPFFIPLNKVKLKSYSVQGLKTWVWCRHFVVAQRLPGIRNFVRQNKRFEDFITEVKYVIVDLVEGITNPYSNIWQKTKKKQARPTRLLKNDFQH
jgi:hypothetical protein